MALRRLDAGLDTFDMADHYGDAELVVGQCFRRLGRPINVLTKWCPPATADAPSRSNSSSTRRRLPSTWRSRARRRRTSR